MTPSNATRTITPSVKSLQTRLPPKALRRAQPWLILLIVGAGALVVFSPFLLLLLNAFKSPEDYATGGPLSLPSAISLEPMLRYVADVQYPTVLWNSIQISALVAVLAVLLSLAAAYAIGIGRIRGNVAITAVLLFATMLPQESIVYPLYFGAQTLGLRNTIWSVVIIFTILQAAFGTYLLGSLMRTFPQSLLEAAELDGANRFQLLFRIVAPVMSPSLSILLVLFFVWTWNEFYIPLVMLTDSAAQTVPIALATLKGQYTMDATELNAGALLSALPTLLFFLFFQRTLTRGVAAGSFK